MIGRKIETATNKNAYVKVTPTYVPKPKGGRFGTSSLIKMSNSQRNKSQIVLKEFSSESRTEGIDMSQQTG